MIVQSYYTGIAQHDFISWKVKQNSYVLGVMTPKSQAFLERITHFLEKLSNEETHIFIENVFALYKKLGIINLRDVLSLNLKQILVFIESIGKLSPKVRHHLIEITSLVFSEIKKSKEIPLDDESDH